MSRSDSLAGVAKRRVGSTPVLSIAPEWTVETQPRFVVSFGQSRKDGTTEVRDYDPSFMA